MRKNKGMIRQMKMNITELALEEATNYLKTLNTKETFKLIAEKYMKLHNNGVFVNFSYNATNAVGLFSSFSHKYGFETNIDVNPSWSREKILKYSRLSKKLEGGIKDLRDNVEMFRKITKKHNEFKRHFQLKNNDVPSNVLESKLSHSYKESDALNFADVLLDIEFRELNNSINNKQKLREMISNLQKNSKYPELELKHVEKEYFKLILKKYFSEIEKYTRDLFENKNVFVIYNEFDWLKKYDDYQSKYDDDYQINDELSLVENKYISVIFNHFNNFELLVQNEEHSYYINHKKTSTRLRYIPTDDAENNYEILNQKLNDFRKKHPEFNVIIELYNDISAKMGKNQISSTLLLQFIFEKYPNSLIDKYNYFLQEIRKANEERMSFKPKYREFPSLLDSFPHLVFDVRKERDFTYWIALKEEKYNEILCNITNDLYELKLYEVRDEEEENKLFGIR